MALKPVSALHDTPREYSGCVMCFHIGSRDYYWVLSTEMSLQGSGESLVFEPEQEYRRSELHDKYGGQRQGGISTPKDHPFIMLFTGETGADYGYHDRLDKGVFYYTGEGQVGDMSYTPRQ